MYCSHVKQFACQCLPQRLKPQTAACGVVFPFSLLSFFSFVFRNILVVSYSIYLQCQSDPILTGPKNRILIGLLALFFCLFLEDNKLEEIV